MSKITNSVEVKREKISLKLDIVIVTKSNYHLRFQNKIK